MLLPNQQANVEREPCKHRRILDTVNIMLGAKKKRCNKQYLGLTKKATLPESAMNLIPSIVIDVSAMFVETIHLRTPSGAISKTLVKKDNKSLNY